jgi:hypothetical protein
MSTESQQPATEFQQEENTEAPKVFAVSKDLGEIKFSRRNFLELAAAASAAVTLTSCGPGTSVPTQEPTPTSAPTSTPKPTSTPLPTSTQTLTATPIPVGVIKAGKLGLYSGPGPEYSNMGVLNWGVTVEVLGRNALSTWLEIKLEDGSIAWCNASLVELNMPLEDIPIEANIPPTPTSTPSPSPSPTITPTLTPSPTPTLPGVVGTVPKGETGINYSISGKTYTMPCGSPIPPGAVCTCDCVTVPSCSCVGFTVCTCDTVCSCDNFSSHYWYPN